MQMPHSGIGGRRQECASRVRLCQAHDWDDHVFDVIDFTHWSESSVKLCISRCLRRSDAACLKCDPDGSTVSRLVSLTVVGQFVCTRRRHVRVSARLDVDPSEVEWRAHVLVRTDVDIDGATFPSAERVDRFFDRHAFQLFGSVWVQTHLFVSCKRAPSAVVAEVCKTGSHRLFA